jgi:hypothetical protein
VAGSAAVFRRQEIGSVYIFSYVLLLLLFGDC